jgi:hypothetical protein
MFAWRNLKSPVSKSSSPLSRISFSVLSSAALRLAALRLVALTVAFGVVFGALTSSAQINLSHGNSTVSIAPVAGPIPAGMFNWSIAGQNQLNQQWFWFRIDNMAPYNVNRTIDFLGFPQINLYDGTRGVRTLYGATNSPVTILIDYHLTGVSALKSDIAESIVVSNTTASSLQFHFFQYADFNLGGSALGDSGVISQNGFTGLYNVADQTDGSIAFQETVATPGADRASVHMPPTTILSLLGTPTNLDNSIGLTGSGNISYAFEWNGSGLGDVTLDPGEVLVISKDKFLQIPEPSVVALISIGTVAWFARKRRGSRG